MNRLDAIAYEAIENFNKEQLNNCKNWALLLRVHGLAGAVNYGALHGDYTQIAACFIAKLGASEQTLLSMSHDEYLLNARLALQLGDAWSRAARIIAPEPTGAANA